MKASTDEKQLDLAIVPVDEDQAEQEPAPKPKKQKKIKEKKSEIELPMLVEIAFTFSGIMLISVSLMVAAISFISGAAALEIFLRTLVSTIVMGGMLWLFNWQFSTGVLQGAMRTLEEEENAKKTEAQAQEPLPGQDGLQLEGVREG
jgi:hypothetical protein